MPDPTSEQLTGPWLSYSDAQKHTSISEHTLRKLVMQDRIPYRKVGRRVLFSAAALDRWVSSNGAVAEKVA